METIHAGNQGKCTAVVPNHHELTDIIHTMAFATQSGGERTMESLLCFSDGISFSTGGALTTLYRNGVVELHCGWVSAINIDDVQRIILDNLVLWENK